MPNGRKNARQGQYVWLYFWSFSLHVTIFLAHFDLSFKACTTNADCRLADWHVKIVLKCSNRNPNPKRLVLGLIRVRLRLRLRIRAF